MRLDSRSHRRVLDIVVRRGVDDEEATVRRVRSALPDDLERLDRWTDADHDVLAVLELVNWLTKDQLLAICRACAQEERCHAERALRTATDALTRVSAARSSAVAIAAPSHGTPEDLEMVSGRSKAGPGHD